MSDAVFTDPDADTEQWVDVRMTDPDEGEWDVDVVVAGGRVEYVDLRVKPEVLTPFVECLIDDLDEEQADRVLAALGGRGDLDLSASGTDDPAT